MRWYTAVRDFEMRITDCLAPIQKPILHALSLGSPRLPVDKGATLLFDGYNVRIGLYGHQYVYPELERAILEGWLVLGRISWHRVAKDDNAY